MWCTEESWQARPAGTRLKGPRGPGSNVVVLIRDQDRDDDPARWRAFLADQGFGHFTASGRGRAVPVVVPTQFVLTEDEVVLHLVTTNPVFDALDENPLALLSVAGDWAFIPGAWKAIGDEDPARGIPTTYYGAVQVTGECRVEAEPDGVASVLETQLDALDPHGHYVNPREHGGAPAPDPRDPDGHRIGAGEVQVRRQRGSGAPRRGSRAPRAARRSRGPRHARAPSSHPLAAAETRRGARREIAAGPYPARGSRR